MQATGTDPQFVKLTVRLTAEAARRFEALAASEQRSVAGQLRHLVLDAIRGQPNPQ